MSACILAAWLRDGRPHLRCTCKVRHMLESLAARGGSWEVFGFSRRPPVEFSDVYLVLRVLRLMAEVGRVS